MKPNGYTVRVDDRRVSVEHRARLSSKILTTWIAGYVGYLFLPPVRRTFTDLLRTRDPIIGGFLLFFLLLPFISGATWFFFASGEVFFCDRQILAFAKRRMWGRWKRLSFSSREISKLTTAWRGGPKQRTYTVLTFVVGTKRYDVLENLTNAQTDQVLSACRRLGLAVEPRDKTSDAMLQDIEQRGWWINPLKTDDHYAKSSKENADM